MAVGQVGPVELLESTAIVFFSQSCFNTLEWIENIHPFYLGHRSIISSEGIWHQQRQYPKYSSAFSGLLTLF